MSTIEHTHEHEHHPARGATIDARSGAHVSHCECGLAIVAVTPGHQGGEWRLYLEPEAPAGPAS